MAKAKISSKDFLDLLDEQNDQPAPAAGSFGRVTSSSAPPPIPGRTAAKSAVVKSEPELATNWQQTGARTNSESTTSAENGNKPAINREQTGNKVGTQPATNRQQSGYKAYTENPASTETGNKVGTQPATLSATKWQQTGNKPHVFSTSRTSTCAHCFSL